MVSDSNDPLKVDPTELRMAADRLDGQASGFQSAHQAAHSRAGNTALGSGSAAAALPKMLAAWEADGARFAGNFAKHAQGHREAADSYVRTDAGGAEAVEGAGSAM
ncbi:type VII secretion target [Mycobacterium sp. IS-1590]|uniref:type VII secretion target n=1 Tax=Mycobacterium sp. IS-1590 TaxID=1772286 RepID=UPI0007DAE1AF|nr:type VII secretion target [Mycobacterium sp. IS-1590]